MSDANPTNVEETKEPETAPIPARDEDGLPLDREPTIDDVRSDGRTHRAAALGCTAVVVALVLAFWIARALLG